RVRGASGVGVKMGEPGKRVEGRKGVGVSGPEAWATELDELAIRLDEVTRAIRSRLDGVTADPRRLDAIEERLAALERLFRKYGGDSAEVLARRAEIATELEDLLGDEERREELRAGAEGALAEYERAARDLSRARAGWGERLAERIHAELADLAMGKARFSVELERRPSSGSVLEVDGEPVEFSPEGFDQVVFQLAANPGEEALPLASVASGGELSRVYLALQLAVLPDAAARPALVFDEIDAGIGGAEAAALGEKLQRLAGRGQVLVVTHLPQVASFADRHCRVRKRVVAGRTRMEVEPLDPDARVEEVARMLAGREVTELSRSHARELIETAGRAGS
ncbi:MAG: hypothetical protein R3325_16380, partial [Thermoanaerobaculia bacterium]|nr:hypothetical protein [Thermoanaerobaculia bacterium]